MYAVTPIRSATVNPAGAAAVRQVPPRTTTAPVVPLRAADEASEILAITRSTVQAAMEVLAGIRPVHQLARRLDPRCLAVLQHRAALIRREQSRSSSPSLARLHKNSIVRSVRACEVAPGIHEASAVVVDDIRARAVAVRLERSKQVWRVTEFMVG
ncbi:Rv3235 family protein [Pseudarthrobacter sp. RMG13]|uniref:Rv3235 family protein n=1 Tax=Pseudarthrobacter humi TaxID=2952523 RepID=A0ABT1LJM8_9MICC|nr:Rv3235 family protein [Pseudarthrobacter humi]MCP8998645.1 Rv3235 family protein [Pseudarthrobacter humi]